jgi:hypothetical protein
MNAREHVAPLAAELTFTINQEIMDDQNGTATLRVHYLDRFSNLVVTTLANRIINQSAINHKDANQHLLHASCQPFSF